MKTDSTGAYPITCGPQQQEAPQVTGSPLDTAADGEYP
ncbi:MAG: hypothetical protein J07HX64_01690 [halophilic archaeon J07HX64]|nr:MAG: hypothetical protein J07HX64_01690 [halophilic archaeon J07HX64]